MSDHHQHSSLLARPPKSEHPAHAHHTGQRQAAPAKPRTRAEAFGRFMEKIFSPQASGRDESR